MSARNCVCTRYEQSNGQHRAVDAHSAAHQGGVSSIEQRPGRPRRSPRLRRQVGDERHLGLAGAHAAGAPATATARRRLVIANNGGRRRCHNVFNYHSTSLCHSGWSCWRWRCGCEAVSSGESTRINHLWRPLEAEGAGRRHPRQEGRPTAYTTRTEASAGGT